MVNNVAKGFLVFFGKKRENKDLSGTDWGSDLDRDRTRRMRNCFADEVVELVLLGTGDARGGDKANVATGIAALAC